MDLEQKPEFVCELCGAYSDSESSYTLFVPLWFTQCERCGRTVCNGCIRDVPDAYIYNNDVDCGYRVCKICYEDIMRETAEMWDREFEDSSEGPNPYRYEED